MSEPLFVYDALLSPSYLSTLAPDARFLCTGNAEGWQLEFDAVPFIVPKAAAAAFGALYELTDNQLHALDRTRGAEHERIRVAVRTNSGKEVTAQAYVARSETAARLPKSRPTQRYLDAMESGYSAHNATEVAWGELRAAWERASD